MTTEEAIKFAEEYRYHDLKKDKNDFPSYKDDRDAIIYYKWWGSDKVSSVVSSAFSVWHYCTHKEGRYCEYIGWRYLPPCEEEE